MRLVRVPGGWIDRNLDLALLGWGNLLADPRPVASYGADGQLLATNDAMLELVGWSIDEVDRRGWIACLYPDPKDQASARLNTERIAASGLPVRHQRTIERSDGTRRVLDLISTGIRLPDGRFAVFAIGADVTERGTLIGDGRGYREMVEDAPDIITRVDVRTGRHMFVSRAVFPITGYTPAEFYDDPELYRRLILPEYREAFRQVVKKVVQGEPQWLMCEYRKKDGGTVSLHQAFYPIRDASGHVVAVEGVSRDMTQVRALERQLQQTVDELRTRNEELSSLDSLKSQLLANVSHELRTPLVTIKGYNELILRGSLGPVTPRQRRALETSSNSTERLVDLIESLLDFARLEEGRLTLKRSRLDVRAPVREAIEALSPRIAEKGLRLVVDLGDVPLEIDGDRLRVLQVMKALLSNAEKFCETPGEITVRAARQAGRVSLQVGDTGVGIPEAALGKIFDRFYQVDASMTRRFGGAGLGLALVREIVSLHGGEIDVQSQEGKGSTFTVHLPAAASSQPGLVVERPVLLVGAPPVRAPLLRARLEAEGFLAFDATSGAEVVRRARRHRPDAVVIALDDALEQTITALRSDPETMRIPVIAMVDGAAREIAMPIADFVVGTTEYARLSESVRRLLGQQTGATAARPLRVLMVDDEPEIVDFTKFVLERDGYEVVIASSGATALAELGRAERPFDLIILDIALEGVDGIELCRQIKAQARTALVPVLMVTAMSDEAVRHGAFAAGADGFLVKPFGVDEFMRQVRLHLRSESDADTPSPSATAADTAPGLALARPSDGGGRAPRTVAGGALPEKS